MDPSTTALINLGDLAKPVVVLIERISEAIGGTFRPWQIRRIAEANADASLTAAIANVEIGELERRALNRLAAEEIRNQRNIEAIAARALPLVEETARPEEIDGDWMANFFDRCRVFSGDEMQGLWSKVLAREANSPGQFSRRTVNLMASLDKQDAEYFTALCGFAWNIDGFDPLVFDLQSEIYTSHGVNFEVLKHLDDIGLISLAAFGSFGKTDLPKVLNLDYHGRAVHLEFALDADNELDIGRVLFSKAGLELAQVCGVESVPGFLDYVVMKWQNDGIDVTLDFSGAAELNPPPKS